MPDEPDDDYQPLDVDAHVPKDPTARRAWAAEMEARSIRRDVLAGQIAQARGALYAAEAAGEQDKAAEIRRELDALVAEHDAL